MKSHNSDNLYSRITSPLIFFLVLYLPTSFLHVPSTFSPLSPQVRASSELERQQVVNEVRRQAEAEKEVAIAETKKKKWVWRKSLKTVLQYTHRCTNHQCHHSQPGRGIIRYFEASELITPLLAGTDRSTVPPFVCLFFFLLSAVLNMGSSS